MTQIRTDGNTATNVQSRPRQLRQWVVIWRLCALLCIPLLAWTHPEKLGSLDRPLLIFSIALIYVVLHGYFMAAVSGRPLILHIVDLSACALLLLAAGDPKLVLFMTMFACSAFLAYYSPRIRDWLPQAGLLGIVYLAANSLAGFSLMETVTSPNELGAFLLIFLFGLGCMFFDIILDRLSSLELEDLLERQRKMYRRRLHDDLGNTLCGLHFKIQSLTALEREGARQALDYLAKGYRQAVNVLGNIVGGMEDGVDQDIYQSLVRVKRSLERETRLAVNLSGMAAGVELSPEISREILAIVREAAFNALKHSGADEVSISIARRKKSLHIVVSDDGQGFDEIRLGARQREGHVGIAGMHERAALIAANLEVRSSPGNGTRVDLDVALPVRSRFGRLLKQDPQQTGKLFSLLIYLKVPVLALVLFQNGMLPPEDKYSAAGIIISASLALDCLLWLALRPFLYQWLIRRPWLISLSFIQYAAVFYVGQKYGYAFYFFYIIYPEAALMLSGLVLGARGNILLAAAFSIAVMGSYFVVAPDPEVISRSQVLEDLTLFVAAIMGIGIACGMAGDCVKRLEREQQKSIVRFLEREREKFVVETHHHLHDLIVSLGEKIAGLHADATNRPSAGELENVKVLSSNLKKRLRSIIVMLD